MSGAVIADAAAKERLKVEGRQLYSPPANPNHNPLPETITDRRSLPWGTPVTERPSVDEPFLWPLTVAQYEDMQTMFADADMRRGRTLSVKELDRSIQLCKRCGVRVPAWMIMSRGLLLAERNEKYGRLDNLPEA